MFSAWLPLLLPLSLLLFHFLPLRAEQCAAEGDEAVLLQAARRSRSVPDPVEVDEDFGKWNFYKGCEYLDSGISGSEPESYFARFDRRNPANSTNYTDGMLMAFLSGADLFYSRFSLEISGTGSDQYFAAVYPANTFFDQSYITCFSDRPGGLWVNIGDKSDLGVWMNSALRETTVDQIIGFQGICRSYLQRAIESASWTEYLQEQALNKKRAFFTSLITNLLLLPVSLSLAGVAGYFLEAASYSLLDNLGVSVTNFLAKIATKDPVYLKYIGYMNTYGKQVVGAVSVKMSSFSSSVPADQAVGNLMVTMNGDGEAELLLHFGSMTNQELITWMLQYNPTNPGGRCSIPSFTALLSKNAYVFQHINELSTTDMGTTVCKGEPMRFSDCLYPPDSPDTNNVLQDGVLNIIDGAWIENATKDLKCTLLCNVAVAKDEYKLYGNLLSSNANGSHLFLLSQRGEIWYLERNESTKKYSANLVGNDWGFPPLAQMAPVGNGSASAYAITSAGTLWTISANESLWGIDAKTYSYGADWGSECAMADDSGAGMFIITSGTQRLWHVTPANPDGEQWGDGDWGKGYESAMVSDGQEGVFVLTSSGRLWHATEAHRDGEQWGSGDWGSGSKSTVVTDGQGGLFIITQSAGTLWRLTESRKDGINWGGGWGTTNAVPDYQGGLYIITDDQVLWHVFGNDVGSKTEELALFKGKGLGAYTPMASGGLGGGVFFLTEGEIWHHDDATLTQLTKWNA